MTTATSVLPASVPHRYQRFSQATFKLTLRDRALQIATAIPLGHIAVWVAAAVYVLTTQKIGAITDHWNDLFPWVGYAWSALIHGHNPFAVPTTFAQSPAWKAVRHDVRNGIWEGQFASGAAIIAFANAYRNPSGSKLSRLAGWLMGYTSEPDWADKVMIALRMPNMHQTYRKGALKGELKRTTVLQYVFAFFSVLLAGLPGNLLGFAYFYGIKPGILDLIHTAHLHLYGWSVTAAGGTGAGATEANLARAGFDAKVIGILGTFFFARRVFLKIGIDYQDFLAEEHATRYIANRRAELGRLRNWLTRPRWPLPATYRAAVWHEVTECLRGLNKRRSGRHVMRWAALALLPAIGWLAWYGQGILAAHGGV
jgi:hypothetical protein